MTDLSAHWDDWPTYFDRLLADRDSDKADEKANLRPRAVHSTGEVDWHEVVTLTKKGEPSGQSHLGKVIKACLAHGWEFKVGRSTYFSGDKLQENGIVKEGHEGEHVWVQAMRGDKYVTYSAEFAKVNGQHVKFDQVIKTLEEE